MNEHLVSVNKILVYINANEAYICIIQKHKLPMKMINVFQLRTKQDKIELLASLHHNHGHNHHHHHHHYHLNDLHLPHRSHQRAFCHQLLTIGKSIRHEIDQKRIDDLWPLYQMLRHALHWSPLRCSHTAYVHPISTDCERSIGS